MGGRQILWRWILENGCMGGTMYNGGRGLIITCEDTQNKPDLPISRVKKEPWRQTSRILKHTLLL